MDVERIKDLARKVVNTYNQKAARKAARANGEASQPNRHDDEDLHSVACLAMLEGWQDHSDKDEGYFFMVGENALKEHLRIEEWGGMKPPKLETAVLRGLHPYRRIDHIDEDGNDILEDIADREGIKRREVDTADKVANTELAERIEQLIERQPIERQHVLQRVLMEGDTQADAARATNTNERTVSDWVADFRDQAMPIADGEAPIVREANDAASGAA